MNSFASTDTFKVFVDATRSWIPSIKYIYQSKLGMLFGRWILNNRSEISVPWPRISVTLVMFERFVVRVDTSTGYGSVLRLGTCTQPLSTLLRVSYILQSRIFGGLYLMEWEHSGWAGAVCVATISYSCGYYHRNLYYEKTDLVYPCPGRDSKFATTR